MAYKIQNIVDNALCTGCRACSGVCPLKAIDMVWNSAGFLIAKVNEIKCNECEICASVCPSIKSNHTINKDVDTFYGKCLKAYIGHSIDPEIRAISQSGGIVTALLLYLLDQKLIDAALVNKFCPENRRPEIVFARTKEQLFSAAGSCYSQSSVSKAILESNEERTAAVVLGCQAESIALFRNANNNKVLPYYTIGLICGGQYSLDFSEKLIDLSNTNAEPVKHFRFRDKSSGEWPGDVKTYTKNQDYTIDKSNRLKLKPVYEAYRCLLCSDKMNIHSDIVAGDPWGINHDENPKGNTVVITRTKKGLELINDAAKKGYISILEIPVNDVLKGQNLDRLKHQFAAAVKVCKDKNHVLPIDFSLSAFDKIKQIKPSSKFIHLGKKRLDFSRRVYIETDRKKIEYLRRKKNDDIVRQLWKHRIVINVKKAIKAIFHRLSK